MQGLNVYDFSKMRRRWVSGVLGASVIAVVAVAVVPGCGDDNATTSSSPEAGADVASGCSAGAKECVTARVGRVCPADGSGWLPVSCGPTELCDEGSCKPDPKAACQSSEDTCVNGSTAMRCRPDRQGFEVTVCPVKTTCQGPGLCKGACVVGSSKCIGTSAVGECTDGINTVQSACSVGELCVSTESTPFTRAACKPAECFPRTNGCTNTCGNKNDKNADQTNVFSTCAETPSGYRWSTTGCLAGQTCNPTGAYCNGGSHAACTGDCSPGQMRCAGNGTQTCGTTGKWGAQVTPCNADPAAATLVCMSDPVNSGKALCGDPVCASFGGACDASGKLRPCGPDGKLGAAVACPTGVCTAFGSLQGGVQPGACRVACQTGDERCVSTGATSYQTCTNGLWSAPISCSDAGSGTCFGFHDPTGRPTRVCGACAPGSHRCTSVDGGTGGGRTDAAVQTCDASGQWGPPAVCMVGSCTTSANGDVACLAQCVPGTTVCVGVPKASGIPSISGTSATGTCTPEGFLPPWSDCPGTQACRKSSSGAALGCVECVGPDVLGGNEQAQIDSRCTGADAGTPAPQLCQSGNTYAGATSDACPEGTSCAMATITRGCLSCLGGGLLCTTTNLNTYGYTCQSYGAGTPAGCGSTPDCCGYYCGSSAGPSLAHCR